VDNPNFFKDYDTSIILPRSLDSLTFLSIIVWYIDSDIHRIYLLEALREVSKSANNFQLRNLLKSKALMRLYLLSSTNWTNRSFFGNLLSDKQSERINKSLSFKRVKNDKVVQPKRKRGYHDKGSLRLAHNWLPTSDISLTELQISIEQKRTSLRDTDLFIEGWIT
jgi:hypothetical protein